MTLCPCSAVVLPSQTLQGSGFPFSGQGRLCSGLNPWGWGGLLTPAGQGAASGLNKAAILNSSFPIAWSQTCLGLSVLALVFVFFLFFFRDRSFLLSFPACFLQAPSPSESGCTFWNRQCSGVGEERILSVSFAFCDPSLVGWGAAAGRTQGGGVCEDLRCRVFDDNLTPE